jgi:hypothetical protein
MRGTWALLLLYACGGNGFSNDRPPPDHGPLPDLPPPPPEMLGGAACVLSDLRMLTACTPNAASGLTVAIGTASVTTNSDGSFTIEKPADATEWIVSGTGIVTSHIPFDPKDTTRRLPAMKDTDYNDLLLANGVVQQAGQGSLVVHAVTSTGSAVLGATAAVNGSGAQTFYDGSDATVWDTDATGANGIAWLPTSPTGPQTLLVTAQSGTKSFDASIVEQAITFVTVKP